MTCDVLTVHQTVLNFFKKLIFESREKIACNGSEVRVHVR